jgi:hypothetical protein
MVGRLSLGIRIRGTKLAKKPFENAAKFKYLGIALTNENLIRERMRSRLNAGNACYHSFQNLISSYLMSKDVQIKICKTIILLVVL